MQWFLGMASSRTSMSTVSGLAREVLMLVGIVAGGDSDHQQGGPGPSNLLVDPPRSLVNTSCMLFPVPTYIALATTLLGVALSLQSRHRS